jgi:CNT family concentrative nucleoside transporter
MATMQSVVGLAAFVALAWLLSENRRAVKPVMIVIGLLAQILLAVLLLRVPAMQTAFAAVNELVLGLQSASQSGTSLVFGYLGGAPLPFEETQPGASFVLAFRSLPLLIVISALTAVLVYWRVLPLLVVALSRLLQKGFGIGGPVALATAANIFVGMVESPLFIRPYLARLSRSELFIVMSAGMATIAGTVLVLYATILGPVIPNAIGHLLTASLISAPAAIVFATTLVPASGPATQGLSLPPRGASSTMDAVTHGTSQGLNLYLQVVAMLVVMVALVHLLNVLLALLPDWHGTAITLQRLLGMAMAPVAYLMGIPWSESAVAGSLLGTKVVLNELLAYLDLSALPDEALSPNSRIILTYALCGFANFGSLGILIGGMATMVPARRDEIVALGPKSILSGVLATCCTGSVVSLVV